MSYVAETVKRCLEQGPGSGGGAGGGGGSGGGSGGAAAGSKGAASEAQPGPVGKPAAGRKRGASTVVKEEEVAEEAEAEDGMGADQEGEQEEEEEGGKAASPAAEAEEASEKAQHAQAGAGPADGAVSVKAEAKAGKGARHPQLFMISTYGGSFVCLLLDGLACCCRGVVAMECRVGTGRTPGLALVCTARTWRPCKLALPFFSHFAVIGKEKILFAVRTKGGNEGEG